MALGRAVAPLRVGGGRHGVALDELTRLDVDAVHEQRLGDLLHVGDRGPRRGAGPGSGNDSHVGELTPGLRVQRSAVQHDRDAFRRHGLVPLARAVGDHRHPLAVHEDPENPRLGGQFVETGEFGGSGVDKVSVGTQIDMGVPAGRGVSLGAAALFGHQLAETQFVDGKPRLGSHLEGEIDREAVGVVQYEGLAAAQYGLTRGPGGLRGLVEQSGARRQGAVERRLLSNRDPSDPAEVGDQFRVSRAHRVADCGHQVGHDGPFYSEQLGGTDDPAQQPPKHVAAALVARRDAVTDDDRGGAAVVGDDAVADVVGMVTPGVPARGEAGHRVDDGAQQIGFIDVVDTLQQAGDPFDAHPGVDVLPRQRAEDLEVVFGGTFAALVLHEHEIPDLDVAAFIGDRTARDAVLGTAVVVDLRARPARTGDAHRPVVVCLPPTLDALRRQPGDLLPQRRGLVVVVEHRGPQPVGVEAVATRGHRIGEQSPGQLDGAALEIIPEREIARHLEEGVVAGCVADLVDVRRPDALLDARRGVVGRRALPEEERDELHHAGVDEQQVGVVEDHRGAGDLGVAGPHEVIEEPLPDLVCLHLVYFLSVFRPPKATRRRLSR